MPVHKLSHLEHRDGLRAVSKLFGQFGPGGVGFCRPVRPISNAPCPKTTTVRQVRARSAELHLASVVPIGFCTGSTSALPALTPYWSFHKLGDVTAFKKGPNKDRG